MYALQRSLETNAVDAVAWSREAQKKKDSALSSIAIRQVSMDADGSIDLCHDGSSCIWGDRGSAGAGFHGGMAGFSMTCSRRIRAIEHDAIAVLVYSTLSTLSCTVYLYYFFFPLHTAR